jgi:hypothetical protein
VMCTWRITLASRPLPEARCGQQPAAAAAVALPAAKSALAGPVPQPRQHPGSDARAAQCTSSVLSELRRMRRLGCQVLRRC